MADSSSIQNRVESFPSIPRSKVWKHCLQRLVPYGISGHVRSVRGTTIVVDGLPVPVGSLVRIVRRNQDSVNAEVIGFDGGRTVLAPLDNFMESDKGIPLSFSKPIVPSMYAPS
ncbi:MAG: hypothetical protein ACOVLE_00760 [Pirellula staleyi]